MLCFKGMTRRDNAAPKDLELEQGLTGGETPLDLHVPSSLAADACALTQPNHAKEPGGPPPAAAEMAALVNTLVE